jgi:quercetin dioxygenase-like cupin family protein
MTMSTLHLIRAGEAPRLPVFGVDVEILLDGATSKGASAVYRVTAASGTGAPLHRHSGQDEMFHGLEGAFDLVVGDRTVRLEPGDFAFAPRGVPHAFTCVGPNAGRLVVFSTPAGHEMFFKDCATAIAEGSFNPESGAAICARHGIELLAPPR